MSVWFELRWVHRHAPQHLTALELCSVVLPEVLKRSRTPLEMLMLTKSGGYVSNNTQICDLKKIQQIVLPFSLQMCLLFLTLSEVLRSDNCGVNIVG